MPVQELTIPNPISISASDTTVEELPETTPEVTRFLEAVQWGTQGVLYTLNDLGATLRKLPSPLWLLLRKRGELIATRLLLTRLTRYGCKSLKTLYHSMTAVKAEEQGKGYGKLLARYGLSRQRELLGRRGLVYAYVEEGNERNLSLLRGLDYSRIGGFHATVFSRLRPQESPRVFRLHPDHEPLMRGLLSNLYADHALTDFEFSLRGGDYWVLIDQGDIVAGVQVDPQRWEIQSIPGPGGFIARRVLPHVPFLKGLFNPQDFRFLKFGSVYFQNGRAESAEELMETMLARYGVKAAMMYWDKRSPVYQQLAGGGRLGLLNRLAETPVHVLGYFQGLHHSDMTDFCSHPLFISPLDI